MLSWLQSEWEKHVSQNIYYASCIDDAFNAPVDSLPLQIRVLIAIVVLFTFSLRFLTPATLPFLRFRELFVERSL